jgi:hypothetical protein
MPITLGNTTISGLGVGGLPAGTVNATTLAAGAARTNFGAGAALQVVQTLKTNAQSFSNTTQDIMSVTITPSSVSSKILLMWGINAWQNGHANFIAFRNSTAVHIGDASGSRTRATHEMHSLNNDQQNNYFGMLLDSPNTTSAVTYKITGRAFNNVTLKINEPGTTQDRAQNTRTASSITVMEIAA